MRWLYFFCLSIESQWKRDRKFNSINLPEPEWNGNHFNLGDSWYYKLWVEPCTTVLLFFPSNTETKLISVNDALFLNGIEINRVCVAPARVCVCDKEMKNEHVPNLELVLGVCLCVNVVYNNLFCWYEKNKIKLQPFPTYDDEYTHLNRDTQGKYGGNGCAPSDRINEEE